MTARGRRLQVRARRLWRWFFPAPVALPQQAREALAAVYPTLDLETVSFHRGLPHLLRLARSEAMAVPDLLASRHTRVYVAPRCWRPRTVRGLGLLVHEVFHALQARDAGRGFGPVRPFLILYFAGAAASGFRYWDHPMERSAHHLAGRSRSRFEAACAAGPQAVGEALYEVCCALATPASGLRFWPDLAASVPGVRHPAVRSLLTGPWLLLWTAVTAGGWLARLLVEAAGALVAGLVWSLGAGLSLGETIGRPARGVSPGGPK